MAIVGVGYRLLAVHREGHRLVGLTVHVLVDQWLPMCVKLLLSIVHVELLPEGELFAAAAADAGGDQNCEEDDGGDDNYGNEPALHRAVAVNPVKRVVIVGDVASATRALRVVGAVLERAAICGRVVVISAGLREGDQ